MTTGWTDDRVEHVAEFAYLLPFLEVDFTSVWCIDDDDTLYIAETAEDYPDGHYYTCEIRGIPKRTESYTIISASDNTCGERLMLILANRNKMKASDLLGEYLE